jgi:hypothetical protein
MTGRLRFPVEGRIATSLQPEVQPIRVSWLYDPRHSYAVCLVIPSRRKPVSWVFARELLADGRLGVEGPGGDVLVSPAADEMYVRIELSSPSGLAALWVNDADVDRFLTATYRLVPAGTESSRIDRDRELADVLTGDQF